MLAQSVSRAFARARAVSARAFPHRDSQQAGRAEKLVCVRANRAEKLICLRGNSDRLFGRVAGEGCVEGICGLIIINSLVE